MDPGQTERRIQTVCLLILSTVAIAAALYLLRTVMIPFVLALFIAFGLTPFIDLQMRYVRLPRWAAVMGTMILGFVILSVIGVLVSTSVSQLSANAGRYQAQIDQLVRRLAATLPLERLGIDAQTALNPLSKIPVESVGGFFMGITNAILGILSQSLLVMVFLLFMLIGGTGSALPADSVWNEVGVRIQRYIFAKVLVSAVTGALVSSVLAILGVDLSLVFGLFAFMLNFIPNVGSVIATLLPLPVVLVSPDISATVAVLAIAIPAVIQLVIGNVVEPRVMGTSLDLHPVAILLALILWGVLWGIVGMLLATPITAVMKILFEKMEITAPLGRLLAGRFETPTTNGD